MQSDNQIFFSYAWGDEKEEGEGREKIVNDLYQSLIADGYHVIRDKYDLGYREFINDFMIKIGRSKNIVIVISEKYLKSPYCMFELFEIARNSNFDSYKFSNKVLPIMVDFIDFSKAKIIEEYFSHWETEFNEWDSLVQKRSAQLSVEQLQRYDRVKMIYQNFGKLSDWLINMNTLNPALLSRDNFDEIKKTIRVGAGLLQPQAKDEKTVQGLAGSVITNNNGARIGQQNIDSNVDNRGANFNL